MEDVQKVYEDIHNIKNNLTSLGMKVDSMFFALVGSEITKDGGIVNENKELKFELSLIKRKVEELEKKDVRRGVYITLVWMALTAFITILIQRFLK